MTITEKNNAKLTPLVDSTTSNKRQYAAGAQSTAGNITGLEFGWI